MERRLRRRFDQLRCLLRFLLGVARPRQKILTFVTARGILQYQVDEHLFGQLSGIFILLAC